MQMKVKCLAHSWVYIVGASLPTPHTSLILVGGGNHISLTLARVLELVVLVPDHVNTGWRWVHCFP